MFSIAEYEFGIGLKIQKSDRKFENLMNAVDIYQVRYFYENSRMRIRGLNCRIQKNSDPKFLQVHEIDKL